MSKKLDPLTIAQIIRFIRARHAGYTDEATHYQTILKKKLRGQFVPVLMRHGDPDANGYANFWPVVNAWMDELKPEFDD